MTKKAHEWDLPAKYRLLVLSFIFLTNPLVTVFDYFPDFIACIILAKALRYYSDRAPYFEEARVGFIRLAILSLAKIPAFFVMTYARGENLRDYDVKNLFSFSFAVIEVIILILIIKNLFTALSYLGERGCATALIKDFPISKGARICSPDDLKNLCYVFVIYRAAATALPEMLLLTRGVEAGDYDNTFNFAKLYPYTIIISVLSVFVFGIIVAKRLSKYAKAILTEGNMANAADELLDSDAKESLSKTLMLRNIGAALSTFVVSAFLTVDVTFDNLFEINLLPRFILAVSLFLGIYKLSQHVKIEKSAYIVSTLYIVSTILSYAFSVAFLTKHGYENLVLLKEAKAAYLPVMISTAAECLIFILLITFCVKILCKFILEHTALPPHSEKYSRLDASYHNDMKKKIYIWGVIASFTILTKLIDVIQKYYSKNSFVSTNSEVLVSTTGYIPWFSVITFAASIAFICFSLHLFSKLKEDVQMKYL